MRLLPTILVFALAFPAFADQSFPIPAKSSAGIGQPVSTEPSAWERPRRREPRQVGNVSIGPTVFSNMNAGGVGFLFAGSYGWDLGDAILKLNGDFMVNGSALWGNVGLGVQGFILQGDTAPYVAFDFGVGFTRTGTTAAVPRNVTGFGVGAQAGVVLFRSSAIHFDVGLRYGLILNQNAFGLPQVFLMKVGIWF